MILMIDNKYDSSNSFVDDQNRSQKTT